MHERLTTKSSWSPPVATRCACGRTVGPTGECSTCRAKRLAATRLPASGPVPGRRRPTPFRFADLQVNPERQEPLPRIRVREFATAGRPPVAQSTPDKSTEEESELQDQSASVSTYVTTASGVRVVVDAVGVTPSPAFPDGYKWTQTIDTNVPLGGTTSPYVDPRPNDDTKPFYWTDAEHAASPTQFRDAPSRPAPAAGTAWWNGTLCLNGVDEARKRGTTVDCITYGFTRDASGAVTRNSVGSSSGGTHRSTLASEFPDWSFTTAGHPGTGAIVGALAGAGIGFLVGGPIGALVGGALGALGGAIFGSFF
jgi:hypothetical protein